MNVLVLTEDLIFSSKIEAAARQCGAVICTATNPDQLDQALREQAFHLAMIDLNSSKASPIDAIQQIHELLPELPIVGYCSHAQTALQQQALDAGCSRVLPRSSFVQQLPELLTGNPAP